MRRKIVFFTLALLLVAGALASLFVNVETASASHCYWHPVYTDYYNGKPTLFVYNGKDPFNPPQASSFYIRYQHASNLWEVVSNDNWGVNVSAPQTPHSGANGWHYYYIATRWYSLHPHWNDDWKWSVWACD